MIFSDCPRPPRRAALAALGEAGFGQLSPVLSGFAFLFSPTRGRAPHTADAENVSVSYR